MNRGGLLLLTLGVAGGGPLSAQVGYWRQDERVVITDQQTVIAVAATDARVYAASTTGLGIYDRRFRQWEPPVTVVDGYPRNRVTVALADPTEEAVWLGTTVALVRYRPMLRTFDEYPVASGVRDLAFDAADAFQGIYIRSAAGWELLPRGAFSSTPAAPPPPGRRIAPLAPGEIDARLPFLRTMGAQVLLDERLRQFHVTSAAAVPGVEEYYLGTDGMGLLFVDALVARIEPVPAGLLSPGAGAVLAVEGGVWVGSDEQGRRAGLTFVSDDLQRYRYEEGPRGTGFRASIVRALVQRGDEIWAGTDQGIVRVEPDVVTRRLQAVDGLPDDDVFGLDGGPAGTWIATARGVARVPPDTVAVFTTDGPFITALAVASSGDSAWVGFIDGLGLATPDGQVFLAPGSDTLADLREAIVAVTRLADTVVAATVDRLLWRAGIGPWHVGRPLGEVAPIYALADDPSGLWVGGRAGLAHVRLSAGAVTPYPVPRDVPAAVRGIAATHRYVWLATEAGLVRFSRDALVP